MEKLNDNLFNSWINMKDIIQEWINLSEPYERSSRNVKVELDLCSYATKIDLEGVTDINTSKLSSKTD